jgi:hypothetical protein
VEGSGHHPILGIKHLAWRTEENREIYFSNSAQSLEWNLNME